MTKVSVIVPCYNSEQFIEDTIDSILNQTYKNFEILAVNDGSKDQTLEILKKYKEQIRIIDIENSGVSNARNVGARYAKGEYLAFCDSDDIWYPEKLEKQVGIGDHVFSFTAVENFGDGMENRFEYTPPGTSDLEGISGLFKCNYVCTSTVMLKRQIFLDSGGFDTRFKVLEDWHLWLKIRIVHEFVFLKTPLCKYRIHRLGLSKDYKTSAIIGLEILEDILDNYYNLSKKERKIVLENMYLNFADQAYYSGSLKISRILYLKALMLGKRIDGFRLKNICLSFLGEEILNRLKKII